jgi:hypothetical protein
MTVDFRDRLHKIRYEEQHDQEVLVVRPKYIEQANIRFSGAVGKSETHEQRWVKNKIGPQESLPEKDPR